MAQSIVAVAVAVVAAVAAYEFVSCSHFLQALVVSQTKFRSVLLLRETLFGHAALTIWPSTWPRTWQRALKLRAHFHLPQLEQ